MPELCGSTTVSAIKVANAASAAVPPCRSICAPASAARGSAALTMPCGGVPADWREVVQPASARAAASGTRRFNIALALLGPHRLGNVREALALEPLHEATRDAASDAGPF